MTVSSRILRFLRKSLLSNRCSIPGAELRVPLLYSTVSNWHAATERNSHASGHIEGGTPRRKLIMTDTETDTLRTLTSTFPGIMVSNPNVDNPIHHSSSRLEVL